MKHLGERLDIHCGGIDNAFPHHTNEIAQSEAYLGHKWCNYWMHVLHLNTAGGKMSKSKGEFLTVSLLEEKNYLPVVYRFFCLLSHYRKSLVFSYENLDNANAAYQKLIEKISKIAPDGEVDEKAFELLKKGFTDAMDNDINTSLAITAIHDVIKADTNGATKLALIADFDRVLSLDLIKNAEKFANEQKSAQNGGDGEFASMVNEALERRTEAKKEKNYALADQIRDELKALGVVIEDTPEGPKWKKI